MADPDSLSSSFRLLKNDAPVQEIEGNLSMEMLQGLLGHLWLEKLEPRMEHVTEQRIIHRARLHLMNIVIETYE